MSESNLATLKELFRSAPFIADLGLELEPSVWVSV